VGWIRGSAQSSIDSWLRVSKRSLIVLSGRRAEAIIVICEHCLKGPKACEVADELSISVGSGSGSCGVGLENGLAGLHIRQWTRD
jgi:hypothetical protein